MGKRQMAGRRGKTGITPGWYDPELPHVWLPYAQMKTVRPPLPVARTEGSRIILADGRELVDGIASWWTACHGYNHPHIRQAVEAQLASMPHVMFGGLVHEQALRLAGRLARLLPNGLERVFFSDSGSVAVEIALKMSTQYWINRGAHRKKQFIAFRGAYHGDTFGAMSVSDLDAGMHAGFSGVVPPQHTVDLPENPAAISALEKLLKDRSGTIAAVIVEPLVQGAGGMKFHDGNVLQRLRALVDQHDVLLIFDEVFTGFGRTGTMFACHQARVVPDIIALSKALTGGTLPLAATVATKKVFDAFWSDDQEKALMHGPTYMANALGCAAANASLELFEHEPRLQQVSDIAAMLGRSLEQCRGLKGVRDIRVRGAIGVVELDQIQNLDAIRNRFIELGVFVRPIGNVIYLTPAFTISAEELATLTSAIVKVVSEQIF
jgi:adenosylmethionine-8-amino-7-oxononanoate aminotransferase